MSFRETLENHVLMNHPNWDDWKCSQCGQSFQKNHYLVNHHKSYHEQGLFQCAANQCNFTATTRHPVEVHYFLMHENACKFGDCGKKFEYRKDLLVHEKTAHKSV